MALKLMALKFTILGCGSSGGVPRPALGWGACDPRDPRNRRRRTSLLVEQRNGTGVTRVLVDTSPDLREQLLDAEVDRLDGVLFTHEHADHTHGIDDLRMVAYAMKRRVDCYFDAPTRASVVGRFAYCFTTPPGGAYPPILTAHDIAAGGKVRIEGAGGPVEVLAIPQHHGDIASLGFRVGGLAYSPDVSGLPEGVPTATRIDKPLAALQGRNSWSSGGTTGYRGPAPPPRHGTHHYHFRLYALDAPLGLNAGIDKAALLRAMQGHILAEAELIGTYSR